MVETNKQTKQSYPKGRGFKPIDLGKVALKAYVLASLGFDKIQCATQRVSLKTIMGIPLLFLLGCSAPPHVKNEPVHIFAYGRAPVNAKVKETAIKEYASTHVVFYDVMYGKTSDGFLLPKDTQVASWRPMLGSIYLRTTLIRFSKYGNWLPCQGYILRDNKTANFSMISVPKMAYEDFLLSKSLKTKPSNLLPPPRYIKKLPTNPPAKSTIPSVSHKLKKHHHHCCFK